MVLFEVRGRVYAFRLREYIICKKEVKKIFDRKEPSRVKKKKDGITGIGVMGETHFERNRNSVLSNSRERNTEKEIFVAKILLCVRHAY